MPKPDLSPQEIARRRRKFMQEQGAIIDRVGWMVLGVFPTADDPDDTSPFAYTVGLTAHGYPELVIAGCLDVRIMHELLNNLADRVYDTAARFTHGQRLADVIHGLPTVIVDGPLNDTLWPGSAVARYGRDKVRLQQLVWPDPQGRFPWEDGYDLDKYRQPLIGRPGE